MGHNKQSGYGRKATAPIDDSVKHEASSWKYVRHPVTGERVELSPEEATAKRAYLDIYSVNAFCDLLNLEDVMSGYEDSPAGAKGRAPATTKRY